MTPAIASTNSAFEFVADEAVVSDPVEARPELAFVAWTIRLRVDRRRCRADT